MAYVVFPELPDGHTLCCTVGVALRMGYWSARDKQGYEYIVGHCFVNGPDRKPLYFMRTDCYGNVTKFALDDVGNVTAHPFIDRGW